MALCPACGSSRVRNDYKPAPLFLRIFFVRALLCDHCNHQFKVFSIADRPPRQRQRPATSAVGSNPLPAARAVDLTRLKGDDRQSEPPDQPHTQIGHDLRTQITQLHAQEAKDQGRPKSIDQEQPRVAAEPTCTHCGSTNVKRRRRTTLERMVLSASDYKAFGCCSCGESFYSKVEGDENKSGAIGAAGSAP
jgi:hypothetical protein